MTHSATGLFYGAHVLRRARIRLGLLALRWSVLMLVSPSRALDEVFSAGAACAFANPQLHSLQIERGPRPHELEFYAQINRGKTGLQSVEVQGHA